MYGHKLALDISKIKVSAFLGILYGAHLFPDFSGLQQVRMAQVYVFVRATNPKLTTSKAVNAFDKNLLFLGELHLLDFVC